MEREPAITGRGGSPDAAPILPVLKEPSRSSSYLFVSLGDNGLPPKDRSSDPQAIDRDLFGGILRLDVDKRPGSLQPNPHPSSTTNYAIPRDNPFIGVTEHNGYTIDPGRVRTEFYDSGRR